MIINRIFLILVFLIALWLAGFYAGKECYSYSGTCFVPIVKDVFDR